MDSDEATVAHEWKHVAMVYEATSRRYMAYENSERVASKAVIGYERPLDENDGFLVLGRSSTMKDNSYTSVIVDDLMFYDRSLNPTEIYDILSFYDNMWDNEESSNTDEAKSVRSTEKAESNESKVSNSKATQSQSKESSLGSNSKATQ